MSLCLKAGIINTEESEAKEGKEFTQGHPSSLEVAEPGRDNILISKPVHLRQFQKFCQNLSCSITPQPIQLMLTPLLPETTFFKAFHYLLLHLLPYLQVICVS